MKKFILMLFTLVIISCSETTNQPQQTFKVGDVVYYKLDSSKVVIVMDLGAVDNDNLLYRVSYKKGDEVKTKFALSSSLFKK